MPCLLQHIIVLRGRLFTAAVLVSFAASAANAETRLRTIRVVAAVPGGVTSVVLESDGPLPEPRTGALDNPARVYLDFEEVRPGPRAAEIVSDPVVRRTRIALYTTDPVVTRVVIDLFKPVPYRVDASGRQAGRIIVLLDPAARPAGVAPAPPVVVREKPAFPSRRPAAADAYDAKAAMVLGRLQELRPVLAAIDRREDRPAADLASMASELEALGATFGAIKPPPPRETRHALILRACAFAARAARLREESARTGDSALTWTAASAAAGALLMIESAASDVEPSKSK